MAVLAVAAVVLLKSVLHSWIDRESPFLFFFGAVMVSAWHGGLWVGLFATLLSAAASDFFFLAPYHTFGDFDRTQVLRLSQFALEGTLISLLAGALHQARERAQAFAAGEQAARAELSTAYEKVHRIAETLQRSLLLKISPGRFPGLDVASLYEPALNEADVGGDFYDAFALSGGQVALVVGDVSGKGLGAATRTAEVKFGLRALLYANAATAGASPEDALAGVNRLLCSDRRDRPLEDDEPGGAAAQPERLVVLSLAVVSPATGEVRIAVAGADPPFVVRREDGSAESISEASGLVLGVNADAVYHSTRLVLAPGDTLFLFTDGLTEARAANRGGAPDRRGVFLGCEGLIALAQDVCRPARIEPAAATGQRVLGGVKRFAGGFLGDDACLLLARRI